MGKKVRRDRTGATALRARAWRVGAPTFRGFNGRGDSWGCHAPVANA
jgi:hypothetical protein